MTILVMGDVVDDIVVRPLSDVTEASDTNAEIRMHPGGSAANVAAWLGHLGADVRFLGRAGSSGVGRHREALEKHGVDARIAGDPDLDTATIVLNVDLGGERTMYVDRGANATFASTDVPTDAFDGVDWLHLTGYSLFDRAVRPVALDLMAGARSRGVGVSVDPSSVAFLRACDATVFLDLIDGVDLIFPNLDEGRFLTGLDHPGEVAVALARSFDHVILKLGGDGSLYAGRDGGALDVSAYTTDVIDTTGAGDSYCAGFLNDWVKGCDPAQAMQAGAGAAALSVGVVGARPPLPPPQDLAGRAPFLGGIR